jgi:rRNA maturation endonuclease Nob1
MDRSKRWHLHCEGCGYARQYDAPVRAPERCDRCGSAMISSTDMWTGNDTYRPDGTRDTSGDHLYPK